MGTPIVLLVGGLLVLAAIAVLLAIWFVSMYNGLVVLSNQLKNAFGQIDVQLKRRHDLIPKLVECVRGYMAHERETLDGVTKSRNAASEAGKRAAADPSKPQAIKELNQAESQLSAGLGRLIALSEAYPDLKANTNMKALQEELTSTEDKISFARQSFNDSVTRYNNQRLVFPTSIIAGMFGFTEAHWLEIDAPAREAPVLSFQ
jgi:LemA protein